MLTFSRTGVPGGDSAAVIAGVVWLFFGILGAISASSGNVSTAVYLGLYASSLCGSFFVNRDGIEMWFLFRAAPTQKEICTYLPDARPVAPL
jgi:hypothetical protein